jgi:NAD(P)-dependent dehydrogenase (short-subunit alcohol dehydrogenase family)
MGDGARPADPAGEGVPTRFGCDRADFPRRTMPDPSGDLTAKICMVTGATSGLGAVTARELAQFGATVVVVGRDHGRCERQVESIKRQTGSRVEALVADLSSQAQVRRLAGAFRRRFARLDVLVNNAGSYFMRRELSVDRLEMTFALNHLAHFLLTNLLLERLEASPSARVVNVSSSAHEQAKMDFEDLQCERHYERIEAYARSKLANLLFTYELARRLEGGRVTVNALDPGIVATNLGSNNGWLRTKVRNLFNRNLIGPEEGAATSVYLARSPEVEGVTGRYFFQRKEVGSSEASHDEADAETLWRMSEDLTGLRSSSLHH